MGRLARQTRWDVSAARRRDARAGSPPALRGRRVVLRGDLGELSTQLERPALWLFA